MRSGHVAALIVIAACVGLLFLHFPNTAVHGDLTAGLPPATPASTNTPVPTVTSTVTPSPRNLLALGLAASRAAGSVHESGNFHSSDNGVFDGFAFTAGLSWQQQAFIDRLSFVAPVYAGKDLGYTNSVKRVAAGVWLAQRVGDAWSCNDLPFNRNRALWRAPRFPLEALDLVGDKIVDGGPAWDVRGTYTRASNGQVSRYLVDVLIDKDDNLIRRAMISGTTQNGSGRARVSGSVKYFDYGQLPTPALPAPCFR